MFALPPPNQYFSKPTWMVAFCVGTACSGACIICTPASQPAETRAQTPKLKSALAFRFSQRELSRTRTPDADVFA